MCINTSKDGFPKYKKQVKTLHISMYLRNSGLYRRAYDCTAFMYTKTIITIIDRLMHLVIGGVEINWEAKMFEFIWGVKIFFFKKKERIAFIILDRTN